MKNNWPTSTIDEISENLDNLRVPVSKLKRKAGDIPYYGATGIVDYVDDFIFDEELLLVGEDGADWSKGANTSFIISGKSWVNNHAHVLRIKNADIQYVNNYLNYADLTNYISGTTRGKLNKASLMKISIPNPPLPIQQKIASILSSVDEAIQKTDQIIRKTEELKRGMMDELLTKGSTLKISEFAEVKRGASPRPIGDKKYFDESGNGRGWIRISDVTASDKYLTETEQYLSELGSSHSVPVDSGDLIMSICATVGRPIFITIPACIHDGIVVFRNIDSNRINKDFFYYQLVRNEVYIKTKGQTGSQMNLNTKIVENTTLHVPNLDFQKNAVQILSKIDEKLLAESQNKLNLMSLKSGLMQDIFNQKVTIN